MPWSCRIHTHPRRVVCPFMVEQAKQAYSKATPRIYLSIEEINAWPPLGKRSGKKVTQDIHDGGSWIREIHTCQHLSNGSLHPALVEMPGAVLLTTGQSGWLLKRLCKAGITNAELGTIKGGKPQQSGKAWSRSPGRWNLKILCEI